MKKTIGVLLLVLLVIGATVGFTILGLHWGETAEKKYTGKIVFQSEQEYGQFKQAVGDQEVDISEMQVLSSDPPIVVEFKVYVPHWMEFPYGEHNADLSSTVLPSILLWVVVVVAGGLIIIAIFLEEKKRTVTT